MTNLEAKQEAIKKAYGEENYNFFKGIIGENGWIGLSRYDFEEDLESEKKFDKMISEIEFEESFEDEQVFYRPKSLQGIENNNGWIKIEREADLPNDEDAIYWALKNGKAVCIELKTPINLKELFSDFLKDKITHYQLIEQPKPPIF